LRFIQPRCGRLDMRALSANYGSADMIRADLSCDVQARRGPEFPGL